MSFCVANAFFGIVDAILLPIVQFRVAGAAQRDEIAFVVAAFLGSGDEVMVLQVVGAPQATQKVSFMMRLLPACLQWS